MWSQEPDKDSGYRRLLGPPKFNIPILPGERQPFHP